MGIRKNKKTTPRSDKKKVITSRQRDFQVVTNKYDLFRKLPKDAKIISIGYNGYEDIEWLIRSASPSRLDILHNWPISHGNRAIRRKKMTDYVMAKSKTVTYPFVNIININGYSMNVFLRDNIYRIFDIVIIHNAYVRFFGGNTWPIGGNIFKNLNINNYIVFPNTKVKFSSMDEAHVHVEKVYPTIDMNNFSIEFVSFEEDSCLALKKNK